MRLNSRLHKVIESDWSSNICIVSGFQHKIVCFYRKRNKSFFQSYRYEVFKKWAKNSRLVSRTTCARSQCLCKRNVQGFQNTLSFQIPLNHYHNKIEHFLTEMFWFFPSSPFGFKFPLTVYFLCISHLCQGWTCSSSTAFNSQHLRPFYT